MSRIIIDAADTLGQMYRDAAHPLRTALIQRGIFLDHTCPVVVPGQPYDIEQGVALFTAKVKAASRLYVSSDFQDHLVYPNRHDNAWFRFVHDMGHLLYQCDFDAAGENRLHPQLWKWLETTRTYWGLSKQEQQLVSLVYEAETFGQTNYHVEHGTFPVSQREFVIQYVQEKFNAPA